MRHLYPETPLIDEPQTWAALRAIARDGAARCRGLVRRGGAWVPEAEANPAARALLELYLPLLSDPPEDRPQVIAHLAQSLDGRIALPDGRSQWISGDADLTHTHRLRALADAVLVGANTVGCDDPRLTVRRVEGSHPLRVVLDPRRRLQADRAVFQDGVAPTLVLTAREGETRLGRADVVCLPAQEGILSPDAILRTLHERGVRRLLIEGGGVTVSRFLQAGRVDRLHLVVAPVLVGEGRSALRAPLGADLAVLPRPATRLVPLGCDWLFDCDLQAGR